MSIDVIRIRGARTHNLKNVDLDIPKHQLVVVTGLSGSGKSSLAFDTLYAEGQRRYVESLSAYARQFLQLMDKPDVDVIEGLSPAISIEQKATSHNPRSTVGTVTEIHDYLRLLFARVGVPHCPEHDLPLQAQTVTQMVDATLAWPEGTRIMILAPLVVERKGQYHDLVQQLRGQGFVRMRVNGVVVELDAFPMLAKTKKHTLEVVIDRLKIRSDIAARLADSFETALRHGGGKARIVDLDRGVEQLFSAQYGCPECQFSLPEMEPRLFSFNNPAGACPDCDGLGQVGYFDPSRVVRSPHLSLEEGAISGLDRRNNFFAQWLQDLSQHYGFDLKTPFQDLLIDIQHVILYGSGTEKIRFHVPGHKKFQERPFEGVIPQFERRYKETDVAKVREELATLRHQLDCSACQGSRLKKEARFVRVGDVTLPEINRASLQEALLLFQNLSLTGQKQVVAQKILREIISRIQFLVDVGLNYLQLNRSADTLSGGEAQRIRLASQIGSGLTGVMYVLDEPSIGLHQRDNQRLLKTLFHLRDLGNTVIVVEHDEEAIRAADFLVDMGPGAGIHGGQVVAHGQLADLLSHPQSPTGQYLSGVKKIAVPKKRRPKQEDQILELTGATGHNLKSVNLLLPLGLFVGITGVSGSGKSTLINDTLLCAVQRHLGLSTEDPAPYHSIKGLEHLDKVVNVDQSPIGRTPRSNPATYTGLFTPIRELFAELPEARARGYAAGRFSFNVRGGRCEACEGDGLIRVSMHFLPDVYVPCDQCQGKRYNRETLDIRYKGRTIHEILAMTVDEGYSFFKAVPSLARRLQTLLDVGLGYISLGQSATTLSGGEAQRIKLALELSRRDTGRTLYILDEPTTGLHFHDIELLLGVLQRLVEQGNSVVVIEHNLDVIKTVDWIIDLGPEGGAGGGTILAQGTPEQLIKMKNSYTGSFLKRTLANK